MPSWSPPLGGGGTGFSPGTPAPAAITRAAACGLILLMIGAGTPAREAAAQVACAATDIVGHDPGCPAGTGTCTISKNYAVGDGCTLDFGTRPVIVTGRLKINCSSIALNAGSLTIAATGFIDGRGNQIGNATDQGGMVAIDTSGAVTITASARIDVSAATTAGTITICAGSSITVAGALKASQLTTMADGGTIQLNAGTDIVTQVGSTIAASGGNQAENGGGEVDLTAGATVTLADAIDVSGSCGGTVQVCAGGATTTSRIQASATGDAGAGGTVMVAAGTAVRVNDKILASGSTSSSGSGSGNGGMICVDAAYGDLTLTANGDLAAEGATPDGTGGEIDLNSQGSTTIEPGTVLSVRGNGDQSCGGTLCIQPNLALTAPGILDASGGAQGGNVDLTAGTDVTLGSIVDASGRAASGYGGNADIEAGFQGSGTLTVVGTVDVGGGACDSTGACGRGGCSNLSGCAVTVTSTGLVRADAPAGGENNLTANEQLTVSGRVNAGANAAPSDGQDGQNVFAYPQRNPPIIAINSVTPPATLSGLVTCSATGQMNCLTPCPVCGDGVVEFPETCDDGNTLGCDGCSAFCKTESCDDHLSCTLDSCDQRLGCLHLPAPAPCTEPPTPSATPTSPQSPTETPAPTATASAAAYFTVTPPPPTAPSPTPPALSTTPTLPAPTASPTADPDPTPPLTAAGDANCDGAVTAADLPAVLGMWASGAAIQCGADADHNGILDARDLAAVAGIVFSDAP